jgi:hypothetical protein
VKEGKRVLFIYHPFSIYYDGKGGVFRFNLKQIPEDDCSFWNDSLWCLFDAKNKEESHLGEFPYELCTFVISTSPQRNMVNDFKKPPVPQYFYMPLWTETELKAIAPLFPNAIDWPGRFKILGGIPRNVLEVTARAPTAMLEAACKLNDCMNIVGLDSTITEKTPKIVHSLVHVTSAPPFTEPSVCYASQAAMEIIVRNKGLKDKVKMRKLLAACEGIL